MSSTPSPSILSTASTALEGLELSPRYTWAGFALLAALIFYKTALSKSPYDAIPAVGSTRFPSSYINAWRTVADMRGVLEEGYSKYKSRVFRIPEFTYWHLILADPKLIDEMRHAPDDVLSLVEATRENIASDYTLGRNVTKDGYHVEVVRGILTRSLGKLLGDVRDEVQHAFDDNIPVTDDWVSIKIYPVMMQIVSRTSNRVFVGEPKCRDPEFAELNIQFTSDCVFGAQILRLFPNILKPLASRWFTNVPRSIETGLRHLKPIIEERQQKIDEYGIDYPDKPCDMLSWLMDAAQGEERSARLLTLRILALNFAAIHTSSMSFTHALYNLAVHPEYVGPMREEVESIVSEQGWTKVALTRMQKLDSFMKESQRFTGLGTVAMQRKAMKPFTFSDGTHVPKGALLSVATTAHHDENVYPHANEFHGFRFSDMRQGTGENTKNQYVATSTEYITFGHGRHACPGRFFAAHELKMMMAHMLLTYDLKLENEGERPKDIWFGPARIPNPEAKILFRKRQN